ncbi:MAG: AAA family ATPase [Phycisphaerales bacterium]|nr:AAA family ATPase [Phycisphaerales bacterium]
MRAARSSTAWVRRSPKPSCRRSRRPPPTASWSGSPCCAGVARSTPSRWTTSSGSARCPGRRPPRTTSTSPARARARGRPLRIEENQAAHYRVARGASSNPSGRGTILCFAGPPGAGKTSLGRSIARGQQAALHPHVAGRRARRGGDPRPSPHVREAMPGRVIQEIRKCGSNNPVFMLDEVDKVGTDFRGDPASAALEVLDPQQNDTFTDHYLDVPFDLSHVFFIATANYMDMVPSALRPHGSDHAPELHHREKLEIARRYLVPRQLVDTGLR